MKFVPDWPRVLARSVSFWFQIFGLVVLIMPEAAYRLTGNDYNPFIIWWASVLLLVFGTFGRLLDQGLKWWQEWARLIALLILIAILSAVLAAQAKAEPASQAETLSIAVPFIAKEEGERLTAYIPIPGDRPTICFGATRGVELGMKATHEECLARLRGEVAEYRARLHKYFTRATVNRRLPATRDAAYTSTAFNCGVSAIGHSTATRRLNAGNIEGGCDALTWWKRAGGRVVRGLFARRKRERALCMIGASGA